MDNVGGLKKCKRGVAFILCPTSKPDRVYWLSTVVVRVVKKATLTYINKGFIYEPQYPNKEGAPMGPLHPPLLMNEARGFKRHVSK